MSIVGKSSQYYSGFSPTSIPGCALWLDGADSNTLTLSGSAVTQWNDKSGNGRNATQATSARRPTYINGVLNFNGANFLTGTNTFSVLNAGTLFAVGRHSSTRGRAIDIRNNTMSLGIELGTTPDLFFHNSSGRWIQSFTNGTNVLQIMVLARNGAVAPQYARNGDSLISFTTAQSASGNNGSIYNIGSDSGVAEFLNGILCEILYYDTYLTNSDRQAIEGYLAAKWGLRTNVPTTHPFKTLTPFSRPFVPVDISSCALWLDAADSGTLAFSSSTNVSTWSDKSGFGNNCSNQSVGTTITYPGTKVNGTNTVNFAAGCIRGAFNGTSVINTTDVSIFIVTTHTAPNNNLRLFSLTPSANYQDDQASQMLVYCSGNYQVTFYRGGAMPTAYTVTQNVPFLYTVTQTSGTGSMWFNGGSNTTAGITTSAFAVTNYNIGTQLLANQNYTGLVCEVVVYNTLLTTTLRQEVETYLANKWGLRGSMPAGHYARLAPAITTAFLPPQIAGCMLWLDGGDSSTMTFSSGTKMSQWRDKSGTNRHAVQATTALQPSWSNGVVALAGAQYMDMSGAFTMLTSGQRIHIFTVDKRGVNPSTHWILGFGGSGGTGIVFGYNGTSSATNATFAYTSAIVNDTTAAIPAYLSSDPPRLWDGGQNGTVRELYLSGTKVASNAYTYTMTQWQSARIGQAIIAANAYYTGNIYEIIVFNEYLGSNERQRVEGYLANKWGVASALPVAHPFKSVGP